MIMKRIFLLIILLQSIASVHAMVYDNRFFPLFQRMFPRTLEKPSIFIPDLIFMLGHNATLDNEETIGIPEVFGKYDLNNLIEAVVLLGKPNPLIGTPLAQFIGRDIPYNLHGKIETQGFALFCEKAINCFWSCGVSCFAMHVFSRISFTLAQNSLQLTPEQAVELDNIRRSIQECVGLQAPKWSKFGFSDIDLYIRVASIWEYCYKMRRINAGLRAGALIPSGQVREKNNPASVPFGGNGHWGVYGALDLELEIKEDWIAGAYFRFSKRFTKTQAERAPIAGEQPLFGALCAPLRINPGLTWVACPYFSLEDIRDGLGVRAQYTLVFHADDIISDARRENRVPEVQLKQINNVSEWTAEYLTATVFYDFAKVRWKKWYAPTISLMWDIPVQFFLSERVSKTNRISLGILVNF